MVLDWPLQIDSRTHWTNTIILLCACMHWTHFSLYLHSLIPSSWIETRIHISHMHKWMNKEREQKLWHTFDLRNKFLHCHIRQVFLLCSVFVVMELEQQQQSQPRGNSSELHQRRYFSLVMSIVAAHSAWCTLNLEPMLGRCCCCCCCYSSPQLWFEHIIFVTRCLHFALGECISFGRCFSHLIFSLSLLFIPFRFI